ncbi:hypothetical protein PBY51_013774 [Eleginops maclovinus]|uniref:C1q domain-containing protein n=1 Tax=Eleginops maclovinus TaxID=56733 RepID=A0AAN8AUQ6_ELEMC|nr:hypothetical protein PBY51_013774 [Eleginops maclovinus]
MMADLKLLNLCFLSAAPPTIHFSFLESPRGAFDSSICSLRFLIMLHRWLIVISALLSFTISSLVAIESCPAVAMPGIPGIPGLPGRDGRDGQEGLKGQSGAVLQGSVGPQKGEKGEPGVSGFLGKRGESGDPGKQGFPGHYGPPGESGEPGAVGIQQQAAFSVARGTNDHPDQASVIRFTNVITNMNDDYNTETGRFRCRVSGTYYFVYHASLDNKLCVLMKLDQAMVASFCDHRRLRRQVTSGSLAIYVSRDQEVWLETEDYTGMRGKREGYSIFSGFLLHPH